MKRLIMILLSAALLLTLALPLAADVAYMPRDSFIEKHWADCSYENRSYYTNGAEGYVLAHKTPDSAEATPLPNGRKYYISNVYKDSWGVLEYDPDTLENALNGDSVSGWVKMSDMVPDYDNDSFMADHQKELIYERTALESVTLELEENGSVYLYKYPGSGEVRLEVDSDWFGEDSNIFSALFTDPAGRLWGYCGYHYGFRDFWVCIDDPHNGALPPDENCVTIVTRPAVSAPTEAPETPTQAPKPAESDAPSGTPAPVGKTVELTPPADKETLDRAAKDHRGTGAYVAAGAGGVVIIAAAVLAAALRKKKQ